MNGWFQNSRQKKSKITFASNICCLGYLFYRIIFGEKPFKNEKERKEKKIPKLNYDSNSIKYKELIENCIKIDYNERWSIEDIQNYISENILEEKSLDEENIETKEIKKEDEKIIINIDNKKDNITEEKNNSEKKNKNIENNENKKIIHKEDKDDNNKISNQNEIIEDNQNYQKKKEKELVQINDNNTMKYDIIKDSSESNENNPNKINEIENKKLKQLN